MSARDSQRTKFWKAWNEAFATNESKTEVTQPWLNEIERSRWFKAEGLTAQTYILRKGPGSIYFGQNKTLRLPLSNCPKALALKWYLHLFKKKDEAWHGREFCKLLISAIERWVSPEDAAKLRAAFVKHKVKHTAKKQMSAETREKLSKRMSSVRNASFIDALHKL